MLSGKVMAIAAQSLSEGVETFSSWVLAGFGAVLGLLLANLDKLKEFISVVAVRHAAWVYFVAATLGLFGKLIAHVVVSGAKGAAASGELAKGVEDIDLNLYLETTGRAFFPPARWMLKRLITKALQGDLTYSQRLWLRCAQVQSMLSIVEMIVLVLIEQHQLNQ